MGTGCRVLQEVRKETEAIFQRFDLWVFHQFVIHESERVSNLVLERSLGLERWLCV